MGSATFFVLETVALVLTAALTPRSRGMTRGTGYAAVALGAAGVLLLMFLPAIRFTSPEDAMWPYYLMPILTIAAFCYREITTRRSRMLPPWKPPGQSDDQQVENDQSRAAPREVG